AIDGSTLLPGAGIGLAGRAAAGGDFFGYIDPDGPGPNTSSDFAFNNNGFVQTYGVNGRIEWDLGGGTALTSITDFKDYKKLLFIDVDGAPVNQLANYAGVNASSTTEELRLNGAAHGLRWVTGLFYLNIKNHSNNGLKAPADSIIATAIRPVDIGTVADLRTHSYSLFGQVEYDLRRSSPAFSACGPYRRRKTSIPPSAYIPPTAASLPTRGRCCRARSARARRSSRPTRARIPYGLV